MLVADAQREVRSVYRNGAVGQWVSGFIWLASAAFGTWGSVRQAIVVVVIGGAFIFPLTRLVLRLLGGPVSLRRENPLRSLAMQVAFIVPLCLPVIAAAAIHRTAWFYPAFMVVVGAHYLPFVFLYGLPHFGVLAGALIGGGVALGMYGPQAFTPGGWLTGAILVVFGFILSWTSRPPSR